MKRFQIYGILSALFLLLSCSGGQPVDQQPPEFVTKGNREIGIGNQKYHQGCYKGALEYYFKAHEIFAAADSQRGVAMCLNNIGTVYRVMGELTTAVRFFDQALLIHADLGDQSEMQQTLTNLSAALIDANRLDAAEQILAQAEKVAAKQQKKPVSLLVHQGILAMKREEFDRAEDFLNQAAGQTDPARPLEFAAAHFALGNLLFETGRLAEALPHYHHALVSDRQALFYKGLGDDLAAIGAVHEKQGQMKQALGFYTRSIKIFALLEDSAKVQELMQSLETVSAKAEMDITITRHFVDSWLAGERLESLCE